MVTTSNTALRSRATLSPSAASALSSVTSGTITFSAGVADHETPCRDLHGLLEAADRALLEVKRSGKRNVAIATAV